MTNATVTLIQLPAGEAMARAQKIIDSARRAIDTLRKQGYSERDAATVAQVYWNNPVEAEPYADKSDVKIDPYLRTRIEALKEKLRDAQTVAFSDDICLFWKPEDCAEAMKILDILAPKERPLTDNEIASTPRGIL